MNLSLLIFFTIIFLFFFGCESVIHKDNNRITPTSETYSFDDKIFHMKNENLISFIPRESIVFFNSDTIRVIDLPIDQAGRLSYSVGKYDVDQIKNEINWTCLKSVSFSLNIGRVIGWTKDCEKSFKFRIKDSINIERVYPTIKFIMENEKLLPKSLDNIINYKNSDGSKINHDLSWIFRLEHYSEESKMRKCSEIY